MLFAVTACFSSSSSDATGASTTTPTGSASSRSNPTVSGPSPSQPALSGTVTLVPGDNLQAGVNQAPAGTTFLFKNGHYPQVEITPKTGDTFSGQSRDSVVLS